MNETAIVAVILGSFLAASTALAQEGPWQEVAVQGTGPFTKKRRCRTEAWKPSLPNGSPVVACLQVVIQNNGLTLSRVLFEEHCPNSGNTSSRCFVEPASLSITQAIQVWHSSCQYKLRNATDHRRTGKNKCIYRNLTRQLSLISELGRRLRVIGHSMPNLASQRISLNPHCRLIRRKWGS
jgi:hypothetical protein